MNEVNYNVGCQQLLLLSYSTGRTVYDAERDLLAIAKFLVSSLTLRLAKLS